MTRLKSNTLRSKLAHDALLHNIHILYACISYYACKLIPVFSNQDQNGINFFRMHMVFIIYEINISISNVPCHIKTNIQLKHNFITLFQSHYDEKVLPLWRPITPRRSLFTEVLRLSLTAYYTTVGDHLNSYQRSTGIFII